MRRKLLKVVYEWTRDRCDDDDEVADDETLAIAGVYNAFGANAVCRRARRTSETQSETWDQQCEAAYRWKRRPSWPVY